MSLFNNFENLVGILFGPSLLSRFKEMILETSVLSARAKRMILKGGR